MRARDNPFTTDRVRKVRYRFQGDWSWESFLVRLADLRYRAAIVGPDGSGKSTLLEDLEPKLRALGFGVVNLRLTGTDNRFPRGYLTPILASAGRRDVILFDGADHLRRVSWLRFTRRVRQAGGLVVTSHRAGLLPTLIECSPSLELLDCILRQLLGEDAAALRKTSRTLYRKHNGNLRNVLRGLYDVYAAKTV